jgi:hypothetical protein
MLADEAVNSGEAANSVADPVTAESVQPVPLMAICLEHLYNARLDTTVPAA